jgi:chromate transporter
VIGAGILGALARRVAPHLFQPRCADAVDASAAPALFDDDTVVAHARMHPAHLARTLLIGLGLWAAPMALLAWGLGPQHLLTQMGWFFSKMALVTFGGAYAALPYVYQNAVAHHGWLTAGQMIDGLGLGETTPGPLILVTTFVGFVGGYTHAVFGAQAPLAAGIAAAAVVTWFTFLPSFVFVFAGAPFIEATHGEQGFTAPLTAITAAVVGVILNLALFFAWHVFWPAGLRAAPDWRALAIAAGAAVALVRWRRSVIEVVGASALAGWLLSGLR